MRGNQFLIILLNILAGITTVYSQEDELLKVFNVREEDGTAVVYATNQHPCEESVLVEFTVLKNMEADVALPYKGVIPANTENYKLFSLLIKDVTKGSQLGYIVKYCHGNIYTKKHDNSYVYLLPYQEGEQYEVGQGYGGKFSHYMKGKQHALDFVMEEGTPICAARGGVVVEVKQNSNKGGKTIKYQEYGNYVTICHDDGTLANYFHLQKGGSKVKVGDKVKAGQVIGLSGNTGWSSGPHLHFQVYTFDEEMQMKSIPTKFKQEDGKAIFLKLSKTGYQSVHE